jgi:hypothetical protein
MLISIICPSCRHVGAVSGASLPRELWCSSCGGRHRFERNEAAERAFLQWRPREDDVQDAQDPTQGPAA